MESSLSRDCAEALAGKTNFLLVSLRMYLFSICVSAEYLGLVLLGVLDQVFVVLVVGFGVHVSDLVFAVLGIFAVVEHEPQAADELLASAVGNHLLISRSRR